MDIAVSF